jgi:topoisomerase-4 subunit B
MAFSGGAVIEPLQRIGDAPKKTSGTRVRAWPDPQFFDSPNIPLANSNACCAARRVLLPGLKSR